MKRPWETPTVREGKYKFHTHITGTSFGKGIVFDLVGRSETTADDEDR